MRSRGDAVLVGVPPSGGEDEDRLKPGLQPHRRPCEASGARLSVIVRLSAHRCAACLEGAGGSRDDRRRRTTAPIANGCNGAASVRATPPLRQRQLPDPAEEAPWIVVAQAVC